MYCDLSTKTNLKDFQREDITLSRRNFDPETRTLRKRTFEDDEEMEDTVEKNVEGLAEQIIVEDEQRKAEDLVCIDSQYSIVCSRTTPKDLLNIAPKRINWDLKREMEKKAAKLERQTQEAIYKLIRSCSHYLLAMSNEESYVCITKVNDWRPRKARLMIWSEQ